MEVEFTARQVTVPKALRAQAEEGLERVARILGRTARASITFRAQRHLQIAELSVKARTQSIEAAGKADTLESALRIAIQHAENQALRYRDRQYERKRLPKLEKRPPRSSSAAPQAAPCTWVAARTDRRRLPRRTWPTPRSRQDLILQVRMMLPPRFHHATGMPNNE